MKPVNLIPEKTAFGIPEPKKSPGFLLWQTTTVWQRLIKKALDPYDLSHPQFVILAVLLWLTENQQAPTQVELVQRTKLDKMTISACLKKLTAQQLVQRFEHRTDTRAKTVHLTEKGKTLVTKLIPIVEGIDAEFFGKASPKDNEALLQVLAQFI